MTVCLAVGGRPKSKKPAPLGGGGASQDGEWDLARSCAQGKEHGKGWAKRCISGPVGHVVYIGGIPSYQSWSRNSPSLATSPLGSRMGLGGRRGRPGAQLGLEVHRRPAAEGGGALGVALGRRWD